MNIPSQLDERAFDTLRRMGGEVLVQKMIRLFLDYSLEKMEEARAAERAERWSGVAGAFHALKSSTAHVGARDLQRLASEIELHCRDLGTSPDGVPALIGEFEQGLTTVRALLKQRLGESE